MTDSSIDEKSGEGDYDVGPSMDELFGEIEEVEEGDVDREETPQADDVEDVTAADVFSQLRDEAAQESGVDDVLEDESPEEIIASADDETDAEEDEIDADLVDEGALDDLLLTGRTRSDEFLWVDSGDADDASATTETESDTEPSTSDDTDDEAGDTAAVAAKAPTDDGHDQADSDPTESTVSSDTDSAAEADSAVTTDSSPSDESEQAESSAVHESRTKSESGTKTDTDSDTDEPTATTDDDGEETSTSDEAAGSSPSTSDGSESDGTAPSAGRVDYALESDASLEDESLVVSDVESTTTDLVPTETESDDSGGFLSWIRSKLPF